MMKRKMLLWVAAAALLLGPARLCAAAGEGLAGTPHDFTDAANYTITGTNGEGDSVTAVGLCTFCHTPHKAQHTALLWNHTDTNNTFSWTDNTTTMAGTALPAFTKTWNGPTPKCLSCHDGSIAVGDVNWYGAGKPSITVTSTDGTTLDGTGKLIDTHFQVGVAGSMNGNHPVALPYPGVGTRNYNGTTTGASYVSGEWSTNPTTNNIVLYKASDATASASISRVTNNPGGGDNLGIECPSCHDPHNKASVDDFFLRGMLTGSDSNYLCLKCHIK